jgi:glycerol-3-phosphate dehydrogenase
MKREEMIDQLSANPDKVWDVLVIGGGASGLGAALESASRGYKTLLLEKADFAKGTSSRSTKLIHGGVRYLEQGDVSLVLEALHERGLLMKNAPHLVSNQAFIIPNYDWWGGPYYTIGLKIYDMMAGKLGLGPSEGISRKETLSELPNVKSEGLRGGVVYYDGQFDDARLAVNLAQTIAEQGGTVLNYMKVTGLLKDDELRVRGVLAVDRETEKEYRIKAKSVVNATGVFVDKILKMDDPEAKKTIRPSQGVHLVLDRSFMPGEAAILIPKTDDKRVLFAVPWYNRIVVGTTDTLIDKASLEPIALEEEIEFILKIAGKYFVKAPRREDVKSVFAGLRPLVAPKSKGKKTKEISRGHKIVVSLSGLITMTGGKWTTYRKMGEDAIEQAIFIGGLEETISSTKNLPIHGASENLTEGHLRNYGTDSGEILKLIEQRPDLGKLLSHDMPYTRAEVVWSVRNEMARTVEDVLARRLRILFLDAKIAMNVAEEVSKLMADELGWDEDHRQKSLKRFMKLAKGYLLTPKSN